MKMIKPFNIAKSTDLLKPYINDLLINAILEKNFADVVCYLDQNADLQTTDAAGRSLLSIAILTQDLRMFFLLHSLISEQEIHKADFFANTPIHIAALLENEIICSTLLKSNADANAINTIGISAFDIILKKNNSKLIEIFKENNKINIYNSKSILSEKNLQKNSAFSFNYLHLYASKGDVKSLELAYKCGEEIDKKAFHDITPLILATTNKHVDCIAFLIQNGANPDLRTENSGCNSLHIAAQKNLFEVVKMFILYGCDLNIVTNSGTHVLEFASQHEDGKIINLIQDYLTLQDSSLLYQDDY